MKKLLALTLIATLIIMVIFVIPVKAQAETCPHNGDWVKVDGLSGLTYDYTAPEGKLIAESCYKAGNHDPVFATYDPALASVTIVSKVFNSPGGVICTAPGIPDPGCAYQELSHASFRLIGDPGTETPTETPPIETPPTETPPTETPPTETPPTETPPTETPPTETPPTEIPPTKTPGPTETPVVEVEVNTGGSLLPVALTLIGFAGIAGINLIARRKK